MKYNKNVKEDESMTGFVNFTNHPSAKWCEKQLGAAGAYGEIVDVLFPDISPDSTNEELLALADSCVEKILELSPAFVLCQGEAVFSCMVAYKLFSRNIPVGAAVSRRNVIESIDTNGCTVKKSVFEFEGFRRFIFAY